MASSAETAQEKALTLEERVLHHDDIDAMIELGALLLYGEIFESQRGRGIQMLERAIKQAQHPRAMRILAKYLLRNGLREDRRRSVLLLERSLKIEEHPLALNLLSNCYDSGNGVSKDSRLAVQLCERALMLEEQNPVLMSNLASLLLESTSRHTQTTRAVALYKQAIHLSSDPMMMNSLGLLYHYGTTNLSRCTKRASKWYRRAIRESQFPDSMYNLAVLLLDNDPSNEDVQGTVRLLEDAMEREQERNVRTIMKLAQTYLEYGIDCDRALKLYETAAIQFNWQEARLEVWKSWIGDMEGVSTTHTRIYNFCLGDFQKNGNYISMVVSGAMQWTGANDIKMNRKEAIDFLQRCHPWKYHGSFSLMLRHDLNAHPAGRMRARRLLRKFDDNIDVSRLTFEEAVVLSENRSEKDREVAMEFFQAPGVENEFAWLGLVLRRGCRKIPFDGHLDCVTKPVRRFALLKFIASLNLASLLLDMKGKQQEAVEALESLLDTDLRLIAMLNLAFILINEVHGVAQDQERGMQLLEDAVHETGDASARAMFASALSERADLDGSDVERGWRMWRSVERDEENKDELRKIRRLVSKCSLERWSAIAAQRQEKLMENCSPGSEGGQTSS